jgi:NitT/TauT family transport system substrate-binding protein
VSLRNRILLLTLAWVALVSGLHACLNVNWPALANEYVPEAKRKPNIAFIPVTCHLACPVTDYISKFSKAGEIFLARMSGFSVP